MPEGDTIARTAASLDRWLAGRVLTRVVSVRERVPPQRLIGTTVERVEARGKHLLIRLSSGEALHTHMRMAGSWHVYRAGERWRRPRHAARVVLEAGDRVAVCFDAPVVELVRAEDEPAHPSLSALGPDVMRGDFDVDEVVRRARSLPGATAIGELLLDQRVVAGIGNIWRCESLFRERIDPHAAVEQVDDRVLRRVFVTAGKLMRSTRRPPAQVYGRAGRPCRRCGAAVTREALGERTLYWCARCQRPQG